ncbi:EAL domain-containing protein [Marinobacter sp. M3C]|jgi:EAL domain-containing protein (putative c-di-GMP-specific phosphodiesterase class I)/DNA-binding response OmpR family regulator|uniref:putative bifunctional diguanylate cyclase/phosphodiesterase n=1 Tax=unclassified Marinobacter TaxID=83889 RepID=UPI00200CD6BF|nr:MULTISPECIES: EAL domain-containing protein [unclassified Marinobacter]MCL1478293.1 EAL domain-containing protein [Marinobacter sp.]MCL1480248.1 EAL domain-containing protein [Marinobacter sp.]MCL1483880.1 EAL domain-containing protein [Marinobacter sp.]MCL1487268.1 EAL domain-containing protein [Marinobacter sp.]UQG55543.1 EAL domain-containing protein [Marinobacter sp. M4C]
MPTRNILGEQKTAEYPSERHNLLIVDDDLAVRMVSRLALTKAGFFVTEASDGHTALSWLESHKFDAILLDARMPGMDGFATCEKMREHLGDDSVPIIIVTGQNDDESIDAAFESGATDFAPKPLNWRIIIQRLNALIRARAIKKHLNNRSHQISSMLKTSAEAMLLLDYDGVIQGTHLIERLPREFSEKIIVGRNFLECLPDEFLQVVDTSLRAARKIEGCENFVFYHQHEGAPHTIQGRFVAAAEGELLCLLQDQSESFLSQRQLFELTYTDPETGIANEKQLMSELAQRLRDGLKQNTHTMVLRYSAFDLSGLEPRIGRPGIVRLVQTFVERIALGLESYLLTLNEDDRPTSFIARLSESDFVVLLSGIRDCEFAEELATVLLRRLATSVDVDGYTCSIDWAVGIADTLEAAATSDGIMSATAYAIQSNGLPINGYQVYRYSAELKERALRDIEIERLLRQDIAEGRLEVHYQPKFDLSRLALIGMEALIRWTSSELGVVSPATFIPIAEKSGLIISLSHLLVEKVFDQIVVWRDQGRAPLPVSINISGIHLNTRTIVEELRACMQLRRIPPELVELEVTESVMVDGTGKALKNLNDLRSMGVRIAIDDFGTGYSSLSYLRTLPCDCLKIDRSFVQCITSDPTAAAIARAIITIGQEVNLHVIAEGVETEEQLEKLAQLGCNSVQGYFTGRPVSNDDFSPFFEGACLGT